MPSSSVIRPFFTRSTEVPVKRIFLPEPAGREPMGRSLKAFPVCVPPPSHCPTTYSPSRSEEHTSELQSRPHLVCRLLLEKKKATCELWSCTHRTCRVLSETQNRTSTRRRGGLI